MIALDTNVISEAMKAETLCLTSVTLVEMLFGIAVLAAALPRTRRRRS